MPANWPTFDNGTATTISICSFFADLATLAVGVADSPSPLCRVTSVLGGVEGHTYYGGRRNTSVSTASLKSKAIAYSRSVEPPTPPL